MSSVASTGTSTGTSTHESGWGPAAPLVGHGHLRGAAALTGALLIAGVATSAIGTSLATPIIEGADYLAAIAANQATLLLSALLLLLSGVASAAIALSLYPVLKTGHPGMAIAAVGFRCIEGVFYAFSGLGLVALVALANHSPSGGLALSASLGDVIKDVRNASNFVFGVVAFGLGASAYYVALLRTNLVPRWLSAWGLIGIALITLTALFTLFEADTYAVAGSRQLLAIPIALQELVLAVWLLVKGYSHSSPR